MLINKAHEAGTSSEFPQIHGADETQKPWSSSVLSDLNRDKPEDPPGAGGESSCRRRRTRFAVISSWPVSSSEQARPASCSGSYSPPAAQFTDNNSTGCPQGCNKYSKLVKNSLSKVLKHRNCDFYEVLNVGLSKQSDCKQCIVFMVNDRESESLGPKV